MREYTFRHGPFYFKVQAEGDKEAVNKARRAIEESFSDDTLDHLKINLTAGAYLGQLYIEPLEITVADIIKREALPEVEVDVPF